MSAFAKCRIKGPGAEEFLDYLVANKLPKKIGRINLCHALKYKRWSSFRIYNNERS